MGSPASRHSLACSGATPAGTEIMRKVSRDIAPSPFRLPFPLSKMLRGEMLTSNSDFPIPSSGTRTVVEHSSFSMTAGAFGNVSSRSARNQ